MNKAIVIAALVAGIALSACRREEHHDDSYKLGAPITSEIAR